MEGVCAGSVLCVCRFASCVITGEKEYHDQCIVEIETRWFLLTTHRTTTTQGTDGRFASISVVIKSTMDPVGMTFFLDPHITVV